MNIAFYIAKRYLISKKSHNVINVISGISVLAIAFTTMAMIVVLSAFNGIEGLVDKLYSTMDTDITVYPAKGKTINTSYVHYDDIRKIEGVRHVNNIIEDNILLKYDNNQVVATVKGVEPGYIEQQGIDSMVYIGRPILQEDGFDFAILGLGLKYELNLPVVEGLYSITRLYAPIRGKKIYKHKENAFNKKSIQVRGVYSINIDLDNKYIIVPFDFAEELLGFNEEVSSIEISLEEGASASRVKKELEPFLDKDMEVKTRAEKNALIYQTNKTEKWVTFIILIFILVIAAFNIVASLTMLIIDKKQDIFILNSMGADQGLIRKIFFYEGMLINVVGAFFGIGFGLILIFLQSEVGLVPLKGGISPYFPVLLKSSDLIAVLVVVIFIGLISSFLPVAYLSKRLLKK